MSLLDDVSIVVTPNGYKAGELYAVIPTYNLGNDLITNGDFTSNITGWGNAFLSSVPTLSWNSGKARITNTTGTNYNTGLQTTNNPFAGLTGRVKVTGNIQIISGAIIGAWTGREQYGAVAVFTLDGAGYFEFELSLDGTTDDLSIYAFASNLVFEIDNIVAKEITSADMDVTRATDATRVDENGLIEDVLSNVPRIDYTGGGCPHILAEPQRTNLITYSEDFSQWIIQSGITITTNTTDTLSPSGLNDASKVVSTDNTKGFYIIPASTTSDVTRTIYLKGSVGGESVTLKDGGGFGGTVTHTLTTEWARYEFKTTNDGNTYKGLYVDDISVGTIYAWAAQMEEGSYATSYIPTSGSTVTRNQDIFSRDGIGSLINSEEGVLFVEMAVLSADTINRYISLSNGTDDNSISFHFRNNTNNQVRVILKSGNVNQFDSTYNPSGSTDFVKVAFKYKVNDFALWVNGTEISIDTSGITFTADTLNRLAFDNGQGASKLFGKVKQLQVYKTALTDTQLAALTS